MASNCIVYYVGRNKIRYLHNYIMVNKCDQIKMFKTFIKCLYTIVPAYKTIKKILESKSEN